MKKLTSMLVAMVMAIGVVSGNVRIEGAEAGEREELQAESKLAAEEEATEESTEPARVVEELVERRTANTKEYRMSDGTVSVQQYAQAVHYRDGAEWKNIDNTLSRCPEEYITENGEMGYAFAQEVNEADMVTVKNGDYELRFGIAGAVAEKAQEAAIDKATLRTAAQKAKSVVSKEEVLKKEAAEKAEKEAAFLEAVEGKTAEQAAVLENTVNRVKYKDVFEATDLEYRIEGNRLSENIVIHCPGQRYEYRFNLKTPGMTGVQNEDGSIDFTANGAPMFTVPAPYMYDQSGTVSEAVTYELTGGEGEYTLTLCADAEWIEADEREFPVIVDPDIIIRQEGDSAGGVISTGYYKSTSGTVVSNPALMYLGYGSGDGYYKGYAKINTLPALPDGAVMVRANLYLAMHQLTKTGSCTMARISARKATGSAWYSQHGTYIQDLYTVTSSSIGEYQYFDITSAAYDWYNGAANYGITFVTENTMTPMASAKVTVGGVYNSAQNLSAPVFQISYRSMLGVEDYYTYHTADTLNAGQLYIGDYNRQAALIKPIAEGGLYTLSYIYNTQLSYWDYSSTSAAAIHTVDYSKMLAGRGWKLSAQESIVSVNVGEGSYLVHADADGTEHFYTKNGTVYESEDGLGTTITQSGNIYTLKDDKDNIKRFKYGFLYEIEDNQGNKVAFLYNTKTYTAGSTAWHPSTSGNQLQAIVEINKGQAAYTIATLSYANNTVATVTDRDGMVTTISTAASGNTRQVNYILDGYGNYAWYGYGGTNYKMSYAYDAYNRYGVQLTYSGKYVSGYSEFYSTSYSAGRTIRSKYAVESSKKHQTQYSYAGEDKTLNTQDDIKTQLVFDYWGRTVSAYSTDPSGKELYGAVGANYTANTGTSKQNNRVLEETVTGGSSENMLYDAGFEIAPASNWTNFTNAASIESTKVHTGTKSAKIVNTDASISPRFKQGLTLSAGNYTFTGYINLTEISGYDESEVKAGARLLIRNSADSEIHSSQVIKSKTDQSADGGWVRLSIPFTVSSAGTYYFLAELTHAKGTLYIDDMQVERGRASSYNMAVNSGFEKSLDGWTVSSGTATAEKNSTIGDSTYLKITGSATGMRSVKQSVEVNKSTQSTFVLSGWAYAAQSLPERDGVSNSFNLDATVIYSDGTSRVYPGAFSRDVGGQWQYISVPIVPDRSKTTVSRIEIIIKYNNNCNNVYFDNISLSMDEVSSYKYDSNGKVVSVLTSETSEVTATYEAGDLKSMTTKAVGTVTNTYDSKHNVTSATNGKVTMNYTYDSTGNVTTTKLSGTDGMFMQGTATYTNYAEQLSSETYTDGTTISYGYDSKRRLESQSSPTGGGSTTTNYRYDEKNLLKQVYIAGQIAIANSYTNGNLTTIARGGYPNGHEGESEYKIEQHYNLGYDIFGNKTSVKIGTDYTLATYTYDGASRMTGMTYGNGREVGYEYDSLGRITKITGGTLTDYTFEYDSAGNMTKMYDRAEATNTYFNYDSVGRLLSVYKYTSAGKGLSHVAYTYDTANRVTGYRFGDGSGNTKYNSYSFKSDGTISSYTDETGNTFAFSYDSLQRVTGKTIRHDGSIGSATVQSIEYAKKTGSSTQTTNRIASYGYRYNNISDTVAFLYTYDSAGNIIKAQKQENGTTRTTGVYEYDSQNQLIYEENHELSESYIYYYDTYGNMVKREVYASTYGDSGTCHSLGELDHTDEYTYDGRDWVDLLVKYNGSSITYDAIGNPLTYYDGSAMSWRGRQLINIRKGGNVTVYKYDRDGNRTQKTKNGTDARYYTWIGGKLMREEWSDGSANKWLEYFYDESGAPEGVRYNDGTATTKYYYVTNAQGDVMEIRNIYNSLIATYSYDAWGKVVAIKDANGTNVTSPNVIASINPIRYRGYYYDSDTGFYCLQSRYYDPELRRFLNADGFVSTGQGFNGLNMFAYCNNNPVVLCDCTGTCPHDGRVYTNGPFAGQFEYNPNCQSCFSHGEYWLTYPDGTSVNMHDLPEIKVHANKSMDEKKAFVQAVYARGIANEANTGIPAALMAAQTFESGYGSSQSAVNKLNLYGLANYKFDSVSECIAYYENLLTTRYSRLIGCDLRTWVYEIGPAGYCTENPNYGDSLWGVILYWDLN